MKSNIYGTKIVDGEKVGTLRIYSKSKNITHDIIFDLEIEEKLKQCNWWFNISKNAISGKLKIDQTHTTLVSFIMNKPNEEKNRIFFINYNRRFDYRKCNLRKSKKTSRKIDITKIDITLPQDVNNPEKVFGLKLINTYGWKIINGEKVGTLNIYSESIKKSFDIIYDFKFKEQLKEYIWTFNNNTNTKHVSGYKSTVTNSISLKQLITKTKKMRIHFLDNNRRFDYRLSNLNIYIKENVMKKRIENIYGSKIVDGVEVGTLTITNKHNQSYSIIFDLELKSKIKKYNWYYNINTKVIRGYISNVLNTKTLISVIVNKKNKKNCRVRYIDNTKRFDNRMYNLKVIFNIKIQKKKKEIQNIYGTKIVDNVEVGTLKIYSRILKDYYDIIFDLKFNDELKQYNWSYNITSDYICGWMNTDNENHVVSLKRFLTKSKLSHIHFVNNSKRYDYRLENIDAPDKRDAGKVVKYVGLKSDVEYHKYKNNKIVEVEKTYVDEIFGDDEVETKIINEDLFKKNNYDLNSIYVNEEIIDSLTGKKEMVRYRDENKFEATKGIFTFTVDKLNPDINIKIKNKNKSDESDIIDIIEIL